MKFNDMKPQVFALAQEAENEIRSQFERIDRIAQLNTLKVMQAFQDNKVSDSCFAGTTGYGYDDVGREVLDKVYAQIFCTDAALVRIGFVNGTHALSAALFAMLKPGDTLLSATGLPYDTLRNAIGIEGDCHGSLKFYGINYAQVDLKADGSPDIGAIKKAAADKSVTAVLIQRSRGYGNRPAFSAEQIGEIARAVKDVDPSINVMVDNCYGEFTGEHEPTEYGVDLMAGSLIKNPGGGLAPTGGYVVGKAELVEKAAMRLTTPGIGGECGLTYGQTRTMLQGLFIAPKVTNGAVKGAILCGKVFELLGFEVSPKAENLRSDIVQAVKCGDAKKLISFCKGIQAAAPIDSFVSPVPGDMPGYEDQVIMAAGAFVQGSTIELSADAPMREPYIAYFQGGLTYEHAKFGVIKAADTLLKDGLLTIE